jgi:hypothetical protein
MEVDAFLADSIETVNGKLYVLGGGWNMLAAPRLPVRHSRLAIGILIHVPYTATNEEHTLQVRLEDADGHVLPIGNKPGAPGEKLREIASTLTVGRPPQLRPGDEQIAATQITIDGLVFEWADRFRFVIAIDGDDVKMLPLRVVVASGPPG